MGVAAPLKALNCARRASVIRKGHHDLPGTVGAFRRPTRVLDLAIGGNTPAGPRPTEPGGFQQPTRTPARPPAPRGAHLATAAMQRGRWTTAKERSLQAAEIQEDAERESVTDVYA